MNLIRLATKQSQRQNRSVIFLYPSSIATYGLPDRKTKSKAGKIKENEWLQPITMYGCNKLSCEHMGRYYSSHINQIRYTETTTRIDFRCIRFPGLISAVTIPSGGTSDFVAEMLHFAAQGKSYECFVRPDTRLPFMVMPDAIKSLIQIESVPKEKLSQHVYNVSSFSMSAQEFCETVGKVFPDASVTFSPHPVRQKIVDSWPADIDDLAARNDWGWAPDYDKEHSFKNYLMPAIHKHYSIN